MHAICLADLTYLDAVVVMVCSSNVEEHKALRRGRIRRWLDKPA